MGLRKETTRWAMERGRRRAGPEDEDDNHKAVGMLYGTDARVHVFLVAGGTGRDGVGVPSWVPETCADRAGGHAGGARGSAQVYISSETPHV